MADVKPLNSNLNGKRRESRKGSTISFGTPPSSIDVSMRRRSTMKRTASGIMGLLFMRRNTLPMGKQEFKGTRYMDTYKLEPDRQQTFSVERVRATAENVLKCYLEHVKYSETGTGKLACNISDMIKNRIKDMNIPRYKIVCQVIITEGKGQGMEAASRCVWNETTDNYACASYKNSSITAIAMIHGVYLD